MHVETFDDSHQIQSPLRWYNNISYDVISFMISNLYQSYHKHTLMVWSMTWIYEVHGCSLERTSHNIIYFAFTYHIYLVFFVSQYDGQHLAMEDNLTTLQPQNVVVFIKLTTSLLIVDGQSLIITLWMSKMLLLIMS